MDKTTVAPKRSRFWQREEGQAVRQIPIEQIVPSPHQPRKSFDAQKLETLAQSIAAYGVLQPLLVRADGEERYVLIAGERRWRACKMAGLSTVPCLLMQSGRQTCTQISLIENLQRQDLSCWEVAMGYRDMMDTFGMTQQEVADCMQVSQSSVANKLRLLQLPPAAQSIIAGYGLTERHARALLQLPEREQVYRALETIVEKSLNVAQSEQLIKKMLQGKPSEPSRGKTTGGAKDRRLCTNTLRRAVALIQKAGIKATTTTNESVDFIEYIIRIPKTS